RPLERFDQLVWQGADKPYRVGHDGVEAMLKVKPPRGRVERCKQLVGRVTIGPGQRVEERRLAGIGVTHQRNRQHLAPRPRATTRAPLPFQLLQKLALLLAAYTDYAGGAFYRI